MKRIVKSEPDFYKQFLKENRPKQWKELVTLIGQECRVYMLDKEQNNQCAYTEVKLQAQISHIDHFIKQIFIRQKKFKRSVFDWQNLFTVTNNEYYGAKFKDKTIQPEDYENVINPAIESTEGYFDYSFYGKILPKNNSRKAIDTIRIFNLNDTALVEQRKEVITLLKFYINDFSEDEIVELIGRFESLIRFFYNQLKN